MSDKSDKFIDEMPMDDLKKLDGKYHCEVDDGEFGQMVFDLRGLLKEVLGNFHKSLIDKQSRPEYARHDDEKHGVRTVTSNQPE